VFDTDLSTAEVRAFYRSWLAAHGWVPLPDYLVPFNVSCDGTTSDTTVLEPEVAWYGRDHAHTTANSRSEEFSVTAPARCGGVGGGWETHYALILPS
jgi:hypothetical protein